MKIQKYTMEKLEISPISSPKFQAFGKLQMKTSSLAEI